MYPNGTLDWELQFNGHADSTDFGVDADALARGSDMLVVKIDTNGSVIWQKTFDGAYGGYDGAAGLVVNGSSQTFVTGITQLSSTNYAMVTYKLNQAGDTLFRAVYDSSSLYDGGVAVRTASTGRCVVTGFSSSATNAFDFVNIRYSNSGVVQEYNRWSASAASIDRPVDLVKNSHEEFYVVGNSFESGQWNIKLLKFDSLFALKWAKTYNSGYDDEAAALEIDANDSLIITGYSKNATGDKQALLLRYRDSTLLWQRTLNAELEGEDAYGTEVVVNSSNDVYICGVSTSSFSKDILPPATTKTAN